MPHDERRGRQRVLPRDVVIGGEIYGGNGYGQPMTHQVEPPSRRLQAPRASAAT